MLYKEYRGSSMLLGILTFLSALTISAVAIYYSVAGLAAIFAAAVIPIIIMGVSLEVGKLVTAVWLHRHWSRAAWWLKTYLSIAVIVLMFITSMGIFGFLSKAHIEQTSMSQEQVALIKTLDDKEIRSQGKIERWTDEMNRLMKGEDVRVDNLIDREQKELDKINALIKAEKDDVRVDFDKQIELQNKRIEQAKERKEADIQAAKDRFEGSFGGGAKFDKAVEEAKANELSVASSAQREIRNINAKLNDALAAVDAKYAVDIKAIQDRIQDLRNQANAKTEDIDARVTELENFIDAEQLVIDQVREEKFGYEKEYRKLEAEVGPIKYIAEFIYGEQANQSLLESAVRWVIIIIIFVFDPLAVLLLIASQYTFQYVREDKGGKLPPKSDPDPDEPNDPEPEPTPTNQVTVAGSLGAVNLGAVTTDTTEVKVEPGLDHSEEKSFSEKMQDELEPLPEEPKPVTVDDELDMKEELEEKIIKEVNDGFDPAEVEGYEEFNKNYEPKEEEKVEAKEEVKEEKVETKEEFKEEKKSEIDDIPKVDNLDAQPDKKIIKTKSTKITEETIELTDPKAVAEALGLNDKKKKEEEPKEIEEEIDIEAIETGKKK